ncbi:hypothetical protein PSCLAVI8L_130355 [Pseudoclavibacter sp. 8L]|nr:hypothetical protein PSCLAVI8L_130355 [Pseudoclavibacter sp. 8L]
MHARTPWRCRFLGHSITRDEGGIGEPRGAPSNSGVDSISLRANTAHFGLSFTPESCTIAAPGGVPPH